MTIIAAFIKPHEAIVATDTVGCRHDGARMVLSKLRAIPHVNAVLAGRGNSFCFDALLLRCLSANVGSFDDLLEQLQAYVVEAFSWAPAGQNEGYEVLAVGYSSRRGRVIARVFRKKDGLEGADDAEVFVAPWDASMPEIPHKPQRLEQIAKAQVRWMRDHFGEAAAGGTLTVCRLTKRSMSITQAATLDAPEFQKVLEL